MKVVKMKDTTLESCVRLAQKGRVLLVRNGSPVALVTGVKGMDEEQIALGLSDKFWTMMKKLRRQKTYSWEEMEQRLAQTDTENVVQHDKSAQDDKLWELIKKRRKQKRISRAELEKRLAHK